jgi:hypothetical protein
MVSRGQFRRIWESCHAGLGASDSALWAIEKSPGYRTSRWFERVKPLPLEDHDSQVQYWRWINQHCRGQVICYSSGEHEEWWGFTHQADIVWWKLKWA